MATPEEQQAGNKERSLGDFAADEMKLRILSPLEDLGLQLPENVRSAVEEYANLAAEAQKRKIEKEATSAPFTGVDFHLNREYEERRRNGRDVNSPEMIVLFDFRGRLRGAQGRIKSEVSKKVKEGVVVDQAVHELFEKQRMLPESDWRSQAWDTISKSVWQRNANLDEIKPVISAFVLPVPEFIPSDDENKRAHYEIKLPRGMIFYVEPYRTFHDELQAEVGLLFSEALAINAFEEPDLRSLPSYEEFIARYKKDEV